MPDIQPFSSQHGEVRYRHTLYADFLTGKKTTNSPEFTSTVSGSKPHQDTARKAFEKLRQDRIPLSPYLDIGAAACVRSTVLENEFNASGAAGDLSYDALQFATLLSPALGYERLPIRIVFDANHLPFADDSFPFIFTFQTLHHFPDPAPAIKEIQRVLAPGGYYYLGEEPIRQTFNARLWRRGSKKTAGEKILMAGGILPFITSIGKEEVEQGILEEAFDLNLWEKTLALFDTVEADIFPYLFGTPVHISKKDNQFAATPFFTRTILFLLGGGINALCSKAPNEPTKPYASILDRLACPTCQKRPPLTAAAHRTFTCPACGAQYVSKNDVIFSLPKQLEKELYGNG